MTASVLTPIYPKAARFITVAREVGGNAVVPTTGYSEIPVADFTPDPKLLMLEDKGMRGSMTSVYDLQPGQWWTEAAIPASPLFGDTIGHILANIMGDWTDTGTAGTPTWTTSSALAVGATSIPVTSGSSAVSGTFIQVDSTAGVQEVVTVGTGSTATSIVLSAATPLRFAHLTGITITTVTAPFTHVFSTLNPASGTGSVSCQPPSHTLIDRNQTAGSAGYYSDVYPYGCFSMVKLTGAATSLLTWEGSFVGWPQQAATQATVSNPSNVRAIPAWKGTSTVGGTTISNAAEWTITLNRELEEIATVSGQQAPPAIARGPLDGTFDIKVNPAVDQTALNWYIQNEQPTLLWSTSNGLSGSSLVSFSVAAYLAGFTSSKLSVVKTAFGYETSGTLVGNTTNAGNSGGYSVCKITLQNAVSSY